MATLVDFDLAAGMAVSGILFLDYLPQRRAVPLTFLHFSPQDFANETQRTGNGTQRDKGTLL